MTYCTMDEARARGASGTDEEVAAAILAAQQRVDGYTGDHFLPVTETVKARVTGDYAPLRRRVQAVTAIAVTAGGVTHGLPVTTWQATPHGVQFRVHGHDVLIAGAEPWAGGWRNLVGNLDGLYVDVTGTFGWPEVPDLVREATSLLAADLAPGAWAPAANAEGDPVGVPPSDDPSQYRTPAPEMVAPAGRLERTTGNAEADRLLAQYVASPVKVG